MTVQYRALHLFYLYSVKLQQQSPQASRVQEKEDPKMRRSGQKVCVSKGSAKKQ